MPASEETQWSTVSSSKLAAFKSATTLSIDTADLHSLKSANTVSPHTTYIAANTYIRLAHFVQGTTGGRLDIATTTQKMPVNLGEYRTTLQRSERGGGHRFIDYKSLENAIEYYDHFYEHCPEDIKEQLPKPWIIPSYQSTHNQHDIITPLTNQCLMTLITILANNHTISLDFLNVSLPTLSNLSSIISSFNLTLNHTLDHNQNSLLWRATNPPPAPRTHHLAGCFIPHISR